MLPIRIVLGRRGCRRLRRLNVASGNDPRYENREDQNKQKKAVFSSASPSCLWTWIFEFTSIFAEKSYAPGLRVSSAPYGHVGAK